MKKEDFKKLKRGDIVESLSGTQFIVVETKGLGIGDDYIYVAELFEHPPRRINYLHLKRHIR
ncbi:MAG: hypothetical protein Athens101410_11 [Parcubacteria group bacterium Athens1014_10]|nr:MAG: hypothetical protein Athens101410_11 [Parcubacteria group bacterium Athens1014_10]TSD06037.1 MAG: hypothetical protein Athens071412_11 [Parcubacteria group bacterium Athens0714_12]